MIGCKEFEATHRIRIRHLGQIEWKDTLYLSTECDDEEAVRYALFGLLFLAGWENDNTMSETAVLEPNPCWELF